MRTDAFEYDLPPELVAQEPAPRRDAARLMVLDRARDGVAETSFAAIGDSLRAGDLLVLNDTRVVPARLLARKPGGGRVDLLLVTREEADSGGEVWRCMASNGKGLRPGARLSIAPGFDADILDEVDGGRIRVRLLAEDLRVGAALERHGLMPLPPYIRREPEDPRRVLDHERYQTVYARCPGAIAAPTAGLHFTEALMRSLEALGVGFARLTLHVGPGTFRPVRGERIDQHRLEPESFHLPEATAAAIEACKARGGRVVAVGTTVTRVLEGRARDQGGVTPGEGWCGLYITPGHRFRVVDALVTNLHLPRSTLLVLVAAFAGRESILAAYREAVARRFRFYSYGDAMLIL